MQILGTTFSQCPFLTTRAQKSFEASFSFSEYVPACKKFGYSWFYNHAIWLAEKHFDPHLRAKIFSKYGICAGTQQIINIHRANSIKNKDQMFRQLLRFMNQKTFFQEVQLCHTQPHIGF